MSVDPRIYFANLPAEQLVDELKLRIQDFDSYLEESGRAALYARMSRTYFGQDPNGKWASSSAVTYGGEQGELVLARINHFRSIIDQRNVHSTGNRPAPEGMATNDSYDAAKAVEVAVDLLEYDLRHGGLEDALVEAGFRESIGCEGWLSQTWDPEAGEDHGVMDLPPPPPVEGQEMPAPQQKVLKTGAVATRVVSFYDVIRDVTRRDMDDQWRIERRYGNKYDLAAQFPEKAEKLIQMNVDSTQQWTGNKMPWRPPEMPQDRNRSRDYVVFYDFYHAKTPACPQGRMLTFCGGEVLGLDRPMAYDEIPLYPLVERVETDRPFGNTANVDLIVPQQIADAAVSTIVTNHDAFGVQNILIPNGSDIELEDLAGGLRAIKYNPGGGNNEPKALQLLQTSEQSYKLVELGVESMESLSSINSVARGNPQASLKSGSALALVQSMATQGNSPRANKFAKFCETVLTARVRLYQLFATVERMVQVVGEDGRTSVLKFSGEKLKAVKKVSINLASPLMRSSAMRMEIADKIMEKFPGKVQPEQYMALIETGRLERVNKRGTREALWIQRENEMLAQGKQIPVIAEENHRLHIDEHMCVTFDEMARANPAVMEAAAKHMSEHRMFLMAEMGQVVGPVDEEGNAAGQPANDNGGQAPAPKADVKGIDTTDNEGIAGALPSMPKNAMTGETASAA